MTPPTPPAGQKTFHKVAIALVVAVGAIAAFVIASPVFAASPSPNPTPSNESTTHNCPNV